MRITVRLVLSLVFVVSLVVGVFSYFQVSEEKNRLEDEIERRSIILGESLLVSVKPLMESRSYAKLQSIAERFANRERLQGVGVFDPNGNPVALSVSLKSDVTKPLEHVVKSIAEARPAGGFIGLGKKDIYLYAIPSVHEEAVLGSLTLFYDASHINVRLWEIWKHNFFRILILSFTITVMTLVVVRWSVTRPIARFEDWVRDLRFGKGIEGHPKGVRGDVLGPIVKEVTLMAKSLASARAKAEEEARLRLHAESQWTAHRLKEHMRVELGGKKLFLVSNREPYMHVKEGRSAKCIMPAGGVVTALDPVMKICDGVWIAHGGGDADRETSGANGRLRVPPDEPAYTLKRVWLTKDEEDGYYYGFSNEGIWPLCHITHTRPVFRLEDWIYYQEVNEKFAESVLKEIEREDSPLVFVQDYHLALAPLLIKRKRPDARVALFWHIPWPNPEAYGICPWHQEILLGMLQADIIGFHTQYHCNNFLDTVDRFLESKVNWEIFSVNRGGHTTLVKPFPISVSMEDAQDLAEAVRQRDALREHILKETGVQADFLAVGVDRIDYTKGIPERFRAVERFLEKYPEYCERFTFVELGAPSRMHIKKYRELASEAEETADKVNWRFQTKRWKPIVFLKAHHSHETINRFYKAADICMVTSLHDGMNLVAKEFVAARHDEDGVLILSQFTGAARELKEAIIVNPYHIEEMADAVYQALRMDPRSRAGRMRLMRAVVKENNIYKWAGDLITDLARLRIDEPAGLER